MLTRFPLVLIACLMSVGCATGPAKPPSVDVTGKWEGDWAMSGAGGPMTMVLQQAGANVTGDVVMRGGSPNSGPVSGAVSGDAVSITYRGGNAHLTVKGNEMNGSTGLSRWTLKRR